VSAEAEPDDRPDRVDGGERTERGAVASKPREQLSQAEQRSGADRGNAEEGDCPIGLRGGEQEGRGRREDSAM
jgi:hypothetical protein